jgi:hypothetical protein
MARMTHREFRSRSTATRASAGAMKTVWRRHGDLAMRCSRTSISIAVGSSASAANCSPIGPGYSAVIPYTRSCVGAGAGAVWQLSACAGRFTLEAAEEACRDGRGSKPRCWNCLLPPPRPSVVPSSGAGPVCGARDAARAEALTVFSRSSGRTRQPARKTGRRWRRASNKGCRCARGRSRPARPRSTR